MSDSRSMWSHQQPPVIIDSYSSIRVTDNVASLLMKLFNSANIDLTGI